MRVHFGARGVWDGDWRGWKGEASEGRDGRNAVVGVWAKMVGRRRRRRNVRGIVVVWWVCWKS